MIRWLFKWAFRIGIVAAVLVVLFVAFKDSVWTMIVERRIRSETGMQARIGKLSTGLFSPVVTIENLKLYNTAEFGGTLFVDIPELHLEVEPLSLAQQRLRLKLVRFNLAAVNIVRNEAGKTNIIAMLEHEQSKASKRSKRSTTNLLNGLEFDGIDVLNLSVGKARYVDLKDQRNNLEIAISMENQVFKNVKTEGDAYAILFMLWLRSGGKLSIAPNAIAKDYFDRRVKDIESRVAREAATAPALPTGR